MNIDRRQFLGTAAMAGAAVDATGAGTLTWPTTPRNSRYARIEVRRLDGMVALTNPIFLGTLS